MSQSPMVRKYSVDPSVSFIMSLKKQSNKNFSRDLKPYVELRIGQDIRRVIGYEERTVNGGFCNTCSFDEIIVDIYFKSIEGYLCKFRFEDSLPSLLNNI